jgi:hypothetical protein
MKASLTSIDNNPTSSKAQTFEGFDFLRAIFAIAIVADHTGLFSIATIQGVTIGTDILYANFSYFAVPVFFQISLFLFYFKSEKSELKSFFQRRLSKLISIYLFWLSSFSLLKILLKKENYHLISFGTISLRSSLEFIVSGGNSPLYFFFSLTFITIIAALIILFFKKLESSIVRIKVSYWLLFASCILIFSFSILDYITNLIGNQRIPFIQAISNITRWSYNPLNFLPYLFAAAIAAQEFTQGKLKDISSSFKVKLWSLFFLCLIFILLEWFLLKNLIHYSRLSLVFGSWLLLYLALILKNKPPHIICFISNLSLGIYAIHLFFTHIFFVKSTNFLNTLFDISPRLDVIARFIIVLSFSISITYLFKKIKFIRGFV